MKEDVLNALCGDGKKYNLIMQNTRQRDIVQLRWEVFVILSAQDYTTKQIAAFFNTSVGNVNHGLRQMIKIQDKGIREPISDTLINKICKYIPSDNIGLKIEALRLKGYLFREIETWFNLRRGQARNKMCSEVKKRELKEFEIRRKRIVKF